MGCIKLSVIVPVYNIKDYIKKCLRSICDQTYKNLEIILVDDGSTDGSGEICDDFCLEDSRIHVVHKKNGGLVSARKAGAQIAKGDYIIAVDGDDWIDKERFQNLVENGLPSFPDMVYLSGHYKEYANMSVLIPPVTNKHLYNKKQIVNDLMEQFCGNGDLYHERCMEFGQWLWCVKREIYCKNQIEIDERISWAEDVICIFACILDSSSIISLCEPSYHYVQRDGSINYQRKKWDENHALIFFRQMKKILSKHIVNDKILNVAVQYIYHNLLITNYKRIYCYYNRYLFPYIPVKTGSRIIIYGAGNLGCEIVNAIDEDPLYEIVAWVDKTRRNNLKSIHKIEPVSVIYERSYDYIVIAILLSDTSKKIKEELIGCGVQKEKIALMQSTEMRMEELERIFK